MKNALRKYGIVPVIAIKDADKALPLAEALIKGGLPVAEITFRTDAAEESIRRITKAYPEMLVGAGTVLTAAQADAAIAAGANFIVAPGLNPETVKHCQSKNIPVVPGCANASDIEAALSLGLDFVKFFPAENLGGVEMLKALSAPYKGISFMPTGGVSEGNLASYLALKNVVVCGGTWIFKENGVDLIDAGNFKRIEELTRAAVVKMHGFHLAHIGINAENEEKALAVANLFSAAFGMSVKDGSSSVFASSEIEVMKAKGKGDMGHIAIGTNDLLRAVEYLKRLGFEFDEEDEAKLYASPDTAKRAFLKSDFGGFAVHLLKK